MPEFLKNLFASDFMGHGFCYLWRPEIVWLHVGSDAMIALAYYSIPLLLLYFVRQRRDLPFNWMFVMFGIFILSCGTTHAMEVWTIWHGTYRLAGVIKLITAGLSTGTAIALVPLIPKALALPSAAQLRAANRELEQEVLNRQRAEEEIKRFNESLERRVIERTAELEASNRDLRKEIADRLRIEQALRESEEQTRLIVDTALDAVITIDATGNIIGWNPRAEEIFGWARPEVTGHALKDTIIPERYRDAHQRGLERYLATGEAAVLGKRIEMTAVHRDGSELSVELAITRTPISDHVCFSAFVRDITDRRLAEQKLQAQAARLDLLSRTTRAIGDRQDLPSILQVVIRSLVDNLPTDFGAVFLCDADQQSLIVANIGIKSQTLAADLAITNQARIVIGRTGLARCLEGELIYEPDIDRDNLPLLRQLAQVGLKSLVFAPLRVESDTVGVLVAARGQLNGFDSIDCEFLRQLSEHVGLAVHQAQLYDALQLAYADLRRTQRAVTQQERLRAVGQMASGIAHDINNAISPAALYIEAILENEADLNPRVRGQLTVVGRAIDDVAATVARMREFYRNREPESTLARVQLNDLVPQVIDLTRARWSDMAQERGIVIEVQSQLAPGLPTITGVESEIREALTNLIFNAVDAMPRGGKLIFRTGMGEGVSDTGESQPVRIEVMDTGIGMNEETRRHCMEPFFTTKGDRGTGLGLAMVYGVAQRHGADIDIESVPGEGTIVRLNFPLRVDTAPSKGRQDAVPGAPTRLRILIVDDNPILLKALRDTLEIDGHTVVAANGGQEGIVAFCKAYESDEPFAAVITDLGMPHVDGRKVAGAVKDRSPSTPVILLTGWGRRTAMSGDSPLPQVDLVLSKPPKLKELRQAFATCIGAR